MSERTADVTVNLREIARVESVDAVRDHVSRFTAPEATQLLGVATGTALVRTVSTLVTGSETVETQTVRTIARDVRREPTQVTRFFLRRKRALRLAVSTLSASKTSQRRRLVIVVKVPRLTQYVSHALVLLFVLFGQDGCLLVVSSFFYSRIVVIVVVVSVVVALLRRVGFRETRLLFLRRRLHVHHLLFRRRRVGYLTILRRSIVRRFRRLRRLFLALSLRLRLRLWRLSPRR
jgi:hypothetical protein